MHAAQEIALQAGLSMFVSIGRAGGPDALGKHALAISVFVLAAASISELSSST